MDGVELVGSLRGKQVPLLLSYLVLARDRPVGREELIGALWPDNAPRSQDAALRVLLSRLRSALGGDVLLGRDELVLSLRPPVWVDIEAATANLERAREALAAGDARAAWALAQVPLNITGRRLLPGAQATWLERARRDLADLRPQALEIIGRAGLLLGGTQLASVERTARSLIEAEPYRESGYVLLMQSLQSQGNAAEAMRIFDRLRRLLRDELGTTPSPEAMRVYEELLNPGSDAAADRRRPEPSGPAIALPAELGRRAASPMIGRVAEIAQLERWLERAPSGPGARSERVLLVGGEPGIGKTRLIAEIAVRAHASGTIVLAGRAPEETLVPFQPFLEALGHYVDHASVDELRTTARADGAELARLVPELRRRMPELPPPEPGEPETERYRLFEAVAGLLGELSDLRPVLIVLDDIHWADRPTLMLLRHLARAPRTARLSVLGVYRSAERWREGFAAALASLRHERLMVGMDLAGLPERDAARLVGLRLGQRPAEDFLRALYEETEGNPFFIEEILRHLEAAGVDAHGAVAADLTRAGLPDGVQAVIARRLQHLTRATFDVLRVGAVIGRDFDAQLLEQVLELDEDQFLAALDEALGAGVIDESPATRGSYVFSHALIREALYKSMSATRQARVHRRVGVALEGMGTAARANVLAHHFIRAAAPGDAERAIRYALQAGDEATQMLAHEQAAEHYAGALEVLGRLDPNNRVQRCVLLLDLGEALVRSGERPRAWGIFREAAAVATELGDAEALARAAIGASRRYVQPPGVIDDELISMLERALSMDSGQASVRRVLLLSRLCGALYFSERGDEMRRLSAEATVLAAELGDPRAAALAAAARRRAYWAPGHLERRLADSTQLLRYAREAGDRELTLQGHAWLVVDLLEAGDRAAVDAQIDAFSVIAQEIRQPLFNWQGAIWRTMKALLAGQLGTAERLAAEALSNGVGAEGTTARQYHAIQLLAIRDEQGRMTELEVPAREALAVNPNRPAWRAVVARLLCLAGREEEARALVAPLAEEAFASIPADGDWMAAMIELADVAVVVGEQDWARLLYAQLAPYRNATVVIGIGAVCLGAVGRSLGRLAQVTGDAVAAREHFERALVLNEAMRAPVQLAHTQLDLAYLLGRGTRARALVAAATQTARELELPALSARLA